VQVSQLSYTCPGITVTLSVNAANVPEPCGSRATMTKAPVSLRPVPAPTLTVNRLDRRLDCLRTGVGVLAVGGASIRSSFWLVLGVDGTEEE
jgi:hypothetical protein